jgi:hypothetical protein
MAIVQLDFQEQKPKISRSKKIEIILIEIFDHRYFELKAFLENLKLLEKVGFMEDFLLENSRIG